ncbi:MAG: class I SAM-dependent methyltransferase [Pseudomonadales bacterium]|nr:class I SAM-dependent methyltransferase [Pseudomonadales bacterium]
MNSPSNALFDESKLDAFIGKLVSDIGGAMAIAPVRIGGELGLYQAMSELGWVTSQQLADATDCAERYIREWLCHQVASGYVEYNPGNRSFLLPPEHAMALANPSSPAYMLPGFAVAASLSENKTPVAEAFRTGEGVSADSQSGCLYCSIAEFFRPGYRSHLLDEWLPALDGVVEKLDAGAKVVDIGCGHGHTTRIMAEAFPNSEFIGVDIDAASIASAKQHASFSSIGDKEHTDNIRFECASAQDFDIKDVDFICCFDALHDMGDPVAASQQIYRSLKPGGTWMIVEPFAHDKLEDNISPMSRLSYAASTMSCVPAALSQDGGFALGAQAGQAKLRDVVVDQGGFTVLRRAAETPLNLILEARR